METKEISENLYIDLDGKGNLFSMTIEHAKENVNISELSYLRMDENRCLTSRSSENEIIRYS